MCSSDLKSYGIRAGVSLNPTTSLNTIEYILDDIDLILIMTVNPGFGGQSFIESMISKIVKTREMIDKRGLKILLEVDGGVKLDNALQLSNLGVDILVAGSAIFGADDIKKKTTDFKNLFV